MISFKLARLTTLNDRVAQRLIAGRFGLSLREFRTLATLHYLGGATVAVLARESFLDSAQVSRMISGLVARGLVVRQGAVARGGTLCLSDAGKDLMREGLPFAALQNGHLTADMSAQDKDTLFRLIDKLTDTVRARYAEVNGEISDLARQSGTMPGPAGDTTG